VQRKPRSVVDGAFRVLRALPESGREHQVARLAHLTGLPRPTVHRLLGQLRDSGAVTWADGHWALSASLLGLAQSLKAQGKADEAAAVDARFRTAWADADTPISSSCFCQPAK